MCTVYPFCRVVFFFFCGSLKKKRFLQRKPKLCEAEKEKRPQENAFMLPSSHSKWAFFSSLRVSSVLSLSSIIFFIRAEKIHCSLFSSQVRTERGASKRMWISACHVFNIKMHGAADAAAHVVLLLVMLLLIWKWSTNTHISDGGWRGFLVVVLLLLLWLRLFLLSKVQQQHYTNTLPTHFAILLWTASVEKRERLFGWSNTRRKLIVLAATPYIFQVRMSNHHRKLGGPA